MKDKDVFDWQKWLFRKLYLKKKSYFPEKMENNPNNSK